MASMASALVGTPIVAPKPRATAGKSRRAMRCKASAASDVEVQDIGYPFVAIVGQEELKQSLILNVIVSAARFPLGDATDGPRVARRNPRRCREPTRITSPVISPRNRR